MELTSSSENTSDNTFISTFDTSFEVGTKKMIESNDPTFRSSRSARRNVATTYDDIEFIEPKTPKRRTVGPKVQYVDSVKKSTRKSKSRRKVKAKAKWTWSWSKIGWILCGVLLLRLVFMDSGVIDFYKMDNVLADKKQYLEDLKVENKNLAGEIKRIRTSPVYQKKITREHLGVIAKDEYLILFSKN